MDFPEHGLIPKQETQAEEFLSSHPSFDGRGIIIAILDTGVDPGAPGLSVTTEGKPKFLDFIDVTGSGDVDISTVRKMDNETRQLEGLSGRILSIPKEWSCPSGEFHLGIKAINQLLPGPLRDRCDKEWKSKIWNKTIAGYTMDCQQALDTLKKSEKDNNDASEDLNAKLNVLKEVAKWKYPGLVCDCLVWQDESGHWRAVVDTSQGSDLSKIKVLGSYRETFQYDTFSSLDMCNYTVDIRPEQNLLVIVSNSGSHATHVASIAAGNGSDSSQMGVAPGAQMISIKIGDNRLESMETGIALMRAIDVCIERGVHLINYSYGESTVCGNCGPLTEAINEAVISHGITFVSSAGNEGPALSTVGAPGGTCTNIIGVGAYVLPSMMKAAYAFHHDLPKEQAFTWSSRGPTFDGWPGPAICAPGGAIASVPNWTLSNVQLKSGTSMSSPNACGCCALILSGLKAENIEWSPFMIRRALVATARSVPIDDPWAVGAGLIQVRDAFEYCKTTRHFRRFNINISVDHYRGVIVRSINSLDITERSFNVTVRPVFIQDSSIPSIEGQQSLIQFRLPIKLTCDVPWLSCPGHLHLTNSARTIMIKINEEALKLKENAAYFGQVILSSAVGDKNITLGTIPVTLIRPIEVDDCCVHKFENIHLTAGQLSRHFLKLNNTCSRGTILLQNLQDRKVQCPSVFVVHTNYHAVDIAFKKAAVNKVVKLYPGEYAEIPFIADHRQILEVCIGKYWNSVSSSQSQISVEIIWSPIMCDMPQTTIYSSVIATRLTLSLSRNVNKLREECFDYIKPVSRIAGIANNGEVQLSVDWKTWSLPLYPSDSQTCHAYSLNGCGKQLFRRLLTYNFTLANKSEVCVEIPVLQDQLYDCPLLSKMWMVFDNNKQLMSVGDSLCKSMTKLSKGDYTIRLQLIHDKLDFLENFKDLCVHVVHKLQNGSIPSPDMYKSCRDAIQLKSKSNRAHLSYGKVRPVYFSRISEEKYPKGASVGSVISGVFCVSIPESSNKMIFSLMKYVIDSKSISKKSPDKKESVEVEINQQYLNCIRDLKIQWISKLSDEKLVESIVNDYSDQLAVRIAQLQRSRQNKVDPMVIIEQCDALLGLINETSLSKTLLMKTSSQSDKSDAEKLRSHLIDALLIKGYSILESKPDNYIDKLKQVYDAITGWIEYDDPKVSAWCLEYFLAINLYGKALNMIFTEKCNLPENRATQIFRLLGWNVIADVHFNIMLIKHPCEFALF